MFSSFTVIVTGRGLHEMRERRSVEDLLKCQSRTQGLPLTQSLSRLRRGLMFVKYLSRKGVEKCREVLFVNLFPRGNKVTLTKSYGFNEEFKVDIRVRNKKGRVLRIVIFRFLFFFLGETTTFSPEPLLVTT